MNESLIKFLGIFLILLFCLSPLGAIDLGQGDNNTQINENNTDFKDLNDTSNETINNNVNDTTNEDNMNFEIEKVNETENNDGMGTELNQMERSRSNFITAYIDDINYGEKPVLKVRYNINTLNQFHNMNISCPQFSKDYSASHEGYGGFDYVIDEHLEPGVYKVHLYYPGGDWYPVYPMEWCISHKTPEWSKDVKFQVKVNSEPNLSLNINNISQGQKLKVKMTGDKELNGTIRLNLNYGRVHYLHLTNGVGETTVSGIAPGTYNATATFDGNYLFKKSEAKTTFTVTANDNPKALLNLHVDNIEFGDDAKLQIRSQDTFNDNVKVKILGVNKTKECTVKVTDGVGETSISDLKPGNYAAITIFDGNDKFRPRENATAFTVDKANPNIKIHVDDITYPENAIIKIKASEKLNGDVKVNLISENDSKTVMVNVKDGVGDASVGNLITETYSVDAIFDGNDTFKMDHASTSFSVGLADTNVSMTTRNIGRQSQLVEIRTNKIFSGDIKLKLKSERDYKEVTIKVVDGVGETTLSCLTPFDTYNATAIFEGNKFFKPGSDNATFKVQPRL